MSVLEGAAGQQADAKVRQLPCLREHRVRNLAKGVETLDYRIEHNYQVLPCIEVFYVAFTDTLAAETKNFCLIKQI